MIVETGGLLFIMVLLSLSLARAILLDRPRGVKSAHRQHGAGLAIPPGRLRHLLK